MIITGLPQLPRMVFFAESTSKTPLFTNNYQNRQPNPHSRCLPHSQTFCNNPNTETAIPNVAGGFVLTLTKIFHNYLCETDTFLYNNTVIFVYTAVVICQGAEKVVQINYVTDLNAHLTGKSKYS